jgi:hypothetical protein
VTQESRNAECCSAGTVEENSLLFNFSRTSSTACNDCRDDASERNGAGTLNVVVE